MGIHEGMASLPDGDVNTPTVGAVAYLVSDATLRQIGARNVIDLTSSARVQWMINRPPIVSDGGTCYLVVRRHEDVYTVAIGRQGMCADIYTEARLTGIAGADVDATVLRLCTVRFLTAIQP